ncbi:sodium:solute symporter [Roseisolibacter sp. H3M3-2]|uniref:sodium:solute symporter n=1 Tax=Roseisolibacter sp. H3M3-2 TaxID=3031323 RepID=UPI0023DC7892|nr:sodium:solute symporter [Roseisolibacter sp. H3M3-2]MDF1501963.1 sodium:solute symporter [Roseisolibacter sp. H3M3-2]
MTSRFGLLDLLVLLAYLAGTTVLGIWIGRKQKDAKDYFVADRAIPWWAVLFSIVASETSALTFISIPGLAYLGNLGFLQVVAGYIIGRIVVSYTLLPRYFEGDLVTAYALLERRFGLGARRFTSIVFMATRAIADSVRVFATAIPVALLIGPAVPREYVMPLAILILGLLTVVYTYKGGMKAVVWTELVQAGVYVLGGISAVVLLGRSVAGGWGSILDQAGAAGKLVGIDWYTGLDRPHTVFAGLIGGAFLAMASHGADQLIVQRLLSSRSLKDAQRALIGSGFVVFVQFTLFLMVGVGLWVLYGGREFPAADQIFPSFIVERMPPGLLGLILAAIVAATMSTHSGTINSLAAATTHDIYLPLTGRSPDDPRTLKMGKLFALVWGVGLTFGALLYPNDPRLPVVVVALAIASFTYGGLLGAFFLGIFWKRAIQRDMILGMSVGLFCMAFIVFAGQIVRVAPGLSGALTPLSKIAWPWYVLIGTTITLAAGILSSFTHPAPAEGAPAASRRMAA